MVAEVVRAFSWSSGWAVQRSNANNHNEYGYEDAYESNPSNPGNLFEFTDTSEHANHDGGDDGKVVCAESVARKRVERC